MTRIKPGTVLLSCEPFAYVGYLYIPRKCDFCMKTEKDHIVNGEEPLQLHYCSGCRVVSYCNRNCQNAGWRSAHKYECKGMRKVFSTNEASANCHIPRLLLRCLLKLKDGKDHFNEVDTGRDGKKKLEFQDLDSGLAENHNDEERMNLLERDISLMKEFLMDADGNSTIEIPDHAELLEICGRVRTNWLRIYRQFGLAAAVYLPRAVLCHSCDPSCVETFEGTKMVIRNIKEIPKRFPVSISFIGHSKLGLLSSERKGLFRLEYGFDCQCEMCQTGFYDKEKRSIICYRKGCNAEIDTITELEVPCKACGHKLRKVQVEEIRNAEAWAINNSLESDTPEVFMRKLKQLNFSCTHWLMLYLYMKASALSVNKRIWDDPLIYDPKFLKGLRRYLSPNSPILGEALVWNSIPLMVLQKSEAANRISKAVEILELSYGKGLHSYWLRSIVFKAQNHITWTLPIGFAARYNDVAGHLFP